MWLRRTAALWMALMLGCTGSPHVVRADRGAAGETLLHIPRAVTVQPPPVTREEAIAALRRLAHEVRLTASPRETVERMFQLDALSGDYLYLQRERKLVPLESGTALQGALTEAEQALATRYRTWCRGAYGLEGDCLGGALVAGKYLDLQGRYMWALALSKSPVLDEFQKALGEMVSLEAVMQAAMWTVGTLLFLLALPEPVTKLLAAAVTATLVLWIGAATLYTLVTGWFQLMEEVKSATTFEELREAGEKYGKVFSREAARAFAMIAMAALNQTAQGFASKVATLPGSAQVSTRAAAQEGLLLSEVGAVEEAAVTAEGFRLALPPGAVAMAARGGRGDRTEKHHIGTVANEKSALRGGPWTPRFQEIFAKAGMRLKDPENVVPIQGHKGPHPELYHRIVYRRLDDATRGCRSISECRATLIRELDDLAKEISTPGSELNQLVTQGKAR
ncbi:AHH domain-containing protein [Hyalangium rubrum]|uniref:AHH domain-containing protein n=1 Tax=Hyalangium rubrum TaxID=3103134 RepID=A0ABU5H833_9BACT|nr:AHH domain-containing protein [Hyalangium sp. s54d21]MDY7229297.1 AHH domain-containing protein [Hyalangium sp. s54d21]